MKTWTGRLHALLIAVLCFSVIIAGCDPRRSRTGDAQTPDTVVPGQGERPAPWTGQGLATPYITGGRELELVYGDARGTVKLGSGKGPVVTAALSPDRQQLVYVVSQPNQPEPDFGWHIYYVNVASGTMAERELTEARGYEPVGRLAWSPCSQYLAIDSGSSAAMRPLLLLKPSEQRVVGTCYAFGFAWSPTTPSRLAVGVISSRPLVPVNELERTVDLVVVDLPSGRQTGLKTGSTTEYWYPLEWTAQGLKVDHAFADPRAKASEASLLNVPARPTTADAVETSAAGPIPAGATVQPELTFGGELLLVDGQGAVLRKLTDLRDGRVFDAAGSADGSVIAYVWWANGENVTRIRTVHLPDLTTGDVRLALSDADRRNAPNGFGPQRLVFGQRHMLLASFYGVWRPDSRAQVYDVDSGKLQLDSDLWLPLWAQTQSGMGTLVGGARTGEAAKTDPSGFNGSERSLVEIDVSTGTSTIVKEGSKTETWWPSSVDASGQVRCLRITSDVDMGMPATVEEVLVTLPN